MSLDRSSHSGSAAPHPVCGSEPSADRPTIERVERILDAALAHSPIFEGRETYVPLPLLREVIRELSRGQWIERALADTIDDLRCIETANYAESGMIEWLRRFAGESHTSADEYLSGERP